MAEIKSFREYIIEKGILNEEKPGWAKDAYDKLAERDAEPEASITPAASSSNASKVEKQEEVSSNASKVEKQEETKKPATSDELNYTPSHPLAVIDSGFTTNPEGDSPVAQVQDLKNKLKVLEDTYKFFETGEVNEVDKFTSVKYKDENVGKLPKDQNFLPLDLTNKTSLAMYEESFKTTWRKNIESWRETHKNVERINTLNLPWYNPKSWSAEKREKVVNELIRSKDAGAITPEALKRYIDYINSNKLEEKDAKEIEKITGEDLESSEEVKEEEFNYSDELINERVIDILKLAAQRAGNVLKNAPSAIGKAVTSNPFKLGSDLAAGDGNKYTADKIFTTAKWSKEGRRADSEDKVKGGLGNIFNDNKSGVYGIDKEFFNNMKTKYVKNAMNIVYKELSFAKPFLTKAKTMIEDREVRHKLVGSDVKYIQRLSGELYGAYQAMRKVGSLLKQNALNYKKALDELLYEYEATEKKAERKMKSLDAETAVEKALGKKMTSDAAAKEKAGKQAAAEQRRSEEQAAADERQRELQKQNEELALHQNLTKKMITPAVLAFANVAESSEDHGSFGFKNLLSYLDGIDTPNKVPKNYTSDTVKLDKESYNLANILGDNKKEFKQRASGIAVAIMYYLLKKDRNALFGSNNKTKIENFLNNYFNSIYNEYQHDSGAEIIQKIKKLATNDSKGIWQLAKEKYQALREKRKADKNKKDGEKPLEAVSARKRKRKAAAPAEKPAEKEGAAEEAGAKDFEGGDEPKSIYNLALDRAKLAANKNE